MERSFNALTVDNDMSTNDVVFALANGLAGNEPVVDPGPSSTVSPPRSTECAKELAKDIAADGEGATKLLEVEVLARRATRSPWSWRRASPAPAWSRRPSSGRPQLGARARLHRRARRDGGYDVAPADARVSVQDVDVYDRAPTAYEGRFSRRACASRGPRGSDLRHGEGTAVAWGCDLSYDYVKINADYTSLIVPRPDGGVAKDDRLANYSPGSSSSSWSRRLATSAASPARAAW